LKNLFAVQAHVPNVPREDSLLRFKMWQSRLSPVSHRVVC
jgi:hypothetical protein